MSAECLRRLFRFIPIALGDTRVGEPDLSHDVGVATLERFWIDDDDLGLANRTAAADDRARIFLVLTDLTHKPLLKSSRIQITEGRSVFRTFERNEQGELGQPIGGMKRLSAEARPSKGFDEPIDGVLRDRLGSAACDSPRAQVELASLGWSREPNAVAISEIGPTAMRDPMPLNCFEPSNRPLEKCQGRHQITRDSRHERMQ